MSRSQSASFIASAIAYADALIDVYEAYALCRQAETIGVPGTIATAKRLMRDANKKADDAFDRLKQEVLRSTVVRSA